MSKIFLITGGVKSGKTHCAVKYFEEIANVTYIGTLKNTSVGTGAQIDENKNRRPSAWETANEYLSPVLAVDENKLYILDSITYLTLNIMHEICDENDIITREQRTEISNRVANEINLFLEKIKEINGDAIIITNELGFSIMPNQGFELVFRDTLANINQMVAREADEIYLSICGTQLRII